MDVLAAYKLPLTSAACEDYLYELQCTVMFMKLYREIFPQKWEKVVQCGITLTKAERVAIAQEFLELVEEELFEIGWGEYCYDLEEATYGIPFHPIGFNVFEEFEEYEGGERFLAQLYLGEIEGATDASQIDWEQLNRLCEVQAAPISYLYNALSIFDRTTKNVWLDAWSENHYEIEWTLENVNALALMWEQALVLRTQFYQLSEWIDTEPTSKNLVLSFWQQVPLRRET